MLQAPNRKIRWYQFSFIIIVTACFGGSTFLLIYQSDSFLLSTNNASYNDNRTEQLAGDLLSPTDILNNPIISLIPLIFGLLVIFFYIPTRSSLGLTNKVGKKEIALNKYGIPERGYSIPYGKIKIRLTRKIFSLYGLFGKEILFSVQIPKDHKEEKRIFDFLSCEKMIDTSSYTVMHKTVKIKNIPMMIIRTKALVSLLLSEENL